ncbi:response regulator transcription factor [Fodinisporobacter ferrooxydans]|uniref:Response regulator transcription factor n=1 Tax=Fodinisporobacter ferrooxydans TaxID=2901836 RepID=A0ABY4CK94_9BACL|nr:response regulator transcription factor [Alicyclobacillaceae bacterium MYW30-H2]
MDNSNKLIFIIDDDPTIRLIIERYLQQEGYRVRTFSDGEDVLDSFRQYKPDMLIMDIMMPGIDGYELCKKVRAESEVPIIMVSAKDEEVDKIVGLELGSDDYLSKPFSPRELVARVKTVFRRTANFSGDAPSGDTSDEVVTNFHDIQIYTDERRVKCNEKEISLTAKEYELFSYLVLHQPKVFTREQLLNQVWGYDYIGDVRAIDDLVKRIRKKLNQCESVVEIKTVWGYGYKIAGPAQISG